LASTASSYSSSSADYSCSAIAPLPSTSCVGDFGEERLIQIVWENRDLPLPRISEAILAAVIDWIGGEEQPDDMTVVLARAR
jgi:hypothetical protein